MIKSHEDNVPLRCVDLIYEARRGCQLNSQMPVLTEDAVGNLQSDTDAFNNTSYYYYYVFNEKELKWQECYMWVLPQPDTLFPDAPQQEATDLSDVQLLGIKRATCDQDNIPYEFKAKKK